jgi:putative ABC transport system substrate-binding protein
VRRREFITLVGGTAAAWPGLARGQQPTIPVIGFLNSASRNLYASSLRAFRKGLAELDYIEDRTVEIDYRWADGRYELLPVMAVELVRRPVDVIFANGPAILSAKAATNKIPVVFSTGFDPIKLGLVASLNRPGGNLTGVSILNSELGPKRLELLRELIPQAIVFGLLVNSDNPNAEPLAQSLRAAAVGFGIQLHVLHANSERDFAPVFARLAELRVDALVIGNDPFFTTRSELLAALARSHAMPAIYQYGEFPIAGGLMSYGGSLTDTYYKAGVYVGRILKGEKPANLPVQQSTNVELVINLKTAKAFGISVPLTLLGRADEVIE